MMLKKVTLTIVLSLHSSLGSARDSCETPIPAPVALTSEQFLSPLAPFYDSPTPLEVPHAAEYSSLSVSSIIPPQSQPLVYAAVEEGQLRAPSIPISLTRITPGVSHRVTLHTSLRPDPRIDLLFVNGRVLTLTEELGEADILEGFRRATRSFMSLYNLPNVESTIMLTLQESMMRFVITTEELFMSISNKEFGSISRGILKWREILQRMDHQQINNLIKSHGMTNMLLNMVNKLKRLIRENGGYDHFLENIVTIKEKFYFGESEAETRKQWRPEAPQVFTEETLPSPSVEEEVPSTQSKQRKKRPSLKPPSLETAPRTTNANAALEYEMRAAKRSRQEAESGKQAIEIKSLEELRLQAEAGHLDIFATVAQEPVVASGLPIMANAATAANVPKAPFPITSHLIRAESTLSQSSVQKQLFLNSEELGMLPLSTPPLPYDTELLEEIWGEQFLAAAGSQLEVETWDGSELLGLPPIIDQHLPLTESGKNSSPISGSPLIFSSVSLPPLDFEPGEVCSEILPLLG
ncbi:hypothetical protein [Candidatus Odyssella thessalonicensis]|uniref:hypothetical protein n=1 Tax=Candidatus Odyssella thessalonicensis TaxID=84647 RepID=UPI000225C1CE|nr:hypothetical protein [Candidatus Odyssella thessalonicensis]